MLPYFAICMERDLIKLPEIVNNTYFLNLKTFGKQFFVIIVSEKSFSVISGILKIKKNEN